MPDSIEPHAQPIPQTGAPAWVPPPEDDNEALVQQRRPQNVRAIFFGDDGLRAGWSVLLYLVLLAALSFAVTRAIHAMRHGAPAPAHSKVIPLGMALATDYGSFAVAVVAALIVSLVERRRFGRYGIGALTPHRIRQFFTGAALGLGLLALLVFTLKSAGLLALDGVLLHGTAAIHYGAIWFVAFLGVGFFEEFLTRGFLQFTLTRGFAGLGRTLHLGYRTSVIVGFWLTALLFSTVFSLGHTSNPGESPIGLLSAGLIGLIFTFSLYRTGSLWWAIGFHAAWDWTQSFLFGVADSGLMMQNHLLSTHPVGSPLLSGGLTGPEGSIYILGVIVLAWITILLALKPEPGSYADPNWTPNDSGQPRVTTR